MEKKDFLLLLGGIALVVSLILITVNKSNRRTAQTTAIITSATGTGCGSGKTVVRFKYTVNGKLLENWTCYDQIQIMKAKFTLNSQATACYNPSDPADSSVIPAQYRCGS